MKPSRQWKSKNFLDHAVQSQGDINKPENLALEFRIFAKDVETLIDCYVQFPQFIEELPDRSLAEDLHVGQVSSFSFRKILSIKQVWARSLDDFERKEIDFFAPTSPLTRDVDEFKTQAVQKYLYDSMGDIGIRLEVLATRFIPTFTRIGELTSLY